MALPPPPRHASYVWISRRMSGSIHVGMHAYAVRARAFGNPRVRFVGRRCGGWCPHDPWPPALSSSLCLALLCPGSSRGMPSRWVWYIHGSTASSRHRNLLEPAAPSRGRFRHQDGSTIGRGHIRPTTRNVEVTHVCLFFLFECNNASDENKSKDGKNGLQPPVVGVVVVAVVYLFT